MTTAFEYTLKAGGLQLEKDYPYTGRNGKCHFDKSRIAASVSNFSVVGLDEDQIAANLLKHGPLAGNVAIINLRLKLYFFASVNERTIKFIDVLFGCKLQWGSMLLGCRHMLEEFHAH